MNGDMDMAAGFGLVQLIFMLVWIILIVLPFWKITSKAGYSGWLSLLILIPLANIIFLYFLAFSKWPSLSRGD